MQVCCVFDVFQGFVSVFSTPVASPTPSSSSERTALYERQRSCQHTSNLDAIQESPAQNVQTGSQNAVHSTVVNTNSGQEVEVATEMVEGLCLSPSGSQPGHLSPFDTSKRFRYSPPPSPNAHSVHSEDEVDKKHSSPRQLSPKRGPPPPRPPPPNISKNECQMAEEQTSAQCDENQKCSVDDDNNKTMDLSESQKKRKGSILRKLMRRKEEKDEKAADKAADKSHWNKVRQMTQDDYHKVKLQQIDRERESSDENCNTEVSEDGNTAQRPKSESDLLEDNGRNRHALLQAKNSLQLDSSPPRPEDAEDAEDGVCKSMPILPSHQRKVESSVSQMMRKMSKKIRHTLPVGPRSSRSDECDERERRKRSKFEVVDLTGEDIRVRKLTYKELCNLGMCCYACYSRACNLVVKYFCMLLLSSAS